MSANKFDNPNRELVKQSFIIIKAFNFDPNHNKLQFENTQLHPIEFEDGAVYFIVWPQTKEIHDQHFKKDENVILEIIRPGRPERNNCYDQRQSQLYEYDSECDGNQVNEDNEINENPHYPPADYKQLNGSRVQQSINNNQNKIPYVNKQKEPDAIKVVKKDVFTSSTFDKSIIKKLQDKKVTYAVFFDAKKQEEFFSWQQQSEYKIHSNLINTIPDNANKEETLEEILLFYENEILYIENNNKYVDLKAD